MSASWIAQRFSLSVHRICKQGLKHGVSKHHNTIKVLVAITPQGTISFLSKAWGGRASDKYITKHCGVLNNLLPGDLILTDRGFTIEDSVSLYCAQVRCPPFTKGKRQLSRHEVDWSREISRVRIHIERVIGQLTKNYLKVLFQSAC